MIIIDLLGADVTAIKNRVLAQGLSTTFLSITVQTIKDMSSAGNIVVAIAQTAGRQATAYDGDVTAPRVTGFHLDFNEPQVQVVLTFSEPVDPRSHVGAERSKRECKHSSICWLLCVGSRSF